MGDQKSETGASMTQAKKPAAKRRKSSASSSKSRQAQKKHKKMTQAQRVYLISLIQDGLSVKEIQALCKTWTKDPWTPPPSTITYWRKKTTSGIKKIKEAQISEVWSEGLAKSEERVRVLKQLAERMMKDLCAGDEDKEKVWLPRLKGYGQGPNFFTATYWEFNSGQLVQLRGILDDIAKETGGRDPKAIAAQNAQVIADFSIPAHLISPSFFDVHRDIRARNNLEYVLKGGRGSTKSSYISLSIIENIVNNPQIHALATRQISNTLKDSVFAQLRWAINELGLESKWRFTVNPLELEYLPTGQKIYFRGADDPTKIKSIKPVFGYIGILWLEELDQYHGPEAVRNIEQSTIRGGDTAIIYKSFNPPKTNQNWANKYVLIPKNNQYIHTSVYLDAPREWLGKPWLDEAEHLKEVNFPAYEHEYLGIANGTGGQVFENVFVKRITNKQIAQFDRIKQGLDWGYFPDPFAWGKMHYDAARRTLYIFDELRLLKTSNRKAYDTLVKDKGYKKNELIIADSASPKDIADFIEYGANIKGAEKGPDSVDYSIKWLQSLSAIIIDPKRAPFHVQEFTGYELEQDKEGNFISSYPDKDNHFIDEVRYGMNLEWRKRGK